MLSERRATKLLLGALKHKKGEHLSLRLDEGVESNTRFANNGVTTNGEVETRRVSVTASSQGRSATVAGNATDAAGLRALVERAESLAAASPVDPEFLPPLGPPPKKEGYLEVDAYDADTARVDAAARVDAVQKAIAPAVAAGLQSAGFLQQHARASTLVNSAGLAVHQRSTEASLSVTDRTPDGSGSGRVVGVSHRLADIDATALGQAAADKAKASAKPEALAPGDYTVVLEAQAVWDLLSFFIYSMDARSAEEGRSWFSLAEGKTRVGQREFDAKITLRSDPADPKHPSARFDGEGQPLRAVTWIEAGSLRTLPRSRWWAKSTGAPVQPDPRSVFLSGGNESFEALVAKVDKGVAVTRFWYNRMLEPRSILATGLTRDGTFAIKGGKLAKSIKNLRYNDSPLTLLTRVVALGRPQRVETRGSTVAVVPPMVVQGFHFESSSDAI